MGHDNNNSMFIAMIRKRTFWVSDFYETPLKTIHYIVMANIEVQWIRVPFRERVLIVMISAVSSTIEM